jgi:glyoxylase-like metal-dependent hydrolase (beta-lactamase superfamily II)
VTTDPPKYTRQEQEPATEEITELAPGVLRTQLPIDLPGLGHVNCYLLEDERGLAVVDPGLPGPESWKALESRLRSAGYKIADVHTAVVTHSHFDHFGGAGQLREEADADILTHESFSGLFDSTDADENPDSESLDLNDEESLERMRARFRRTTPWGTTWGPPPDDELRLIARVSRRTKRIALPEPSVKVVDSQIVRLARREWIAVHTPGHTHDHLCLYDPVERLMISGDHVLPTITPHIAGMGSQADPLARFFESLARMHDFDVRLVLPAHGHPFTDLAGRADHIREHHDERLEVIRAAADDLPEGTVPDYMRRLFKERSWGSMAESETFAHLEHLRILGQATTSERSDGMLTYSIAR